MMIHGDLREREKVDLQALVQESRDVRVLLYTSVIESGVSIDIPNHYDKIFFFIGFGGPVPIVTVLEGRHRASVPRPSPQHTSF